jgi:hypothetical protein
LREADNAASKRSQITANACLSLRLAPGLTIDLACT